MRSDDRGDTWHDLGERVERVTALVTNQRLSVT
jgi:hypothetical protein